MTWPTWTRPALGLTYALTLTLGSVGPATAQGEAEAIIRERAASHGVSGDYLACIARLESGFNPRAVGALGEVGIFQLLRGGLRDTFDARGYTDVWSVAEQADFAAWAISQHMDRHWLLASRRCR